MPVGIPKPKGNELIDRLNALDEEARKNEVIMAGLRREARALRATDVSMAYQVEGLVEFAVGNRKKGAELFERAIEADPNRYVIRSNYAANLFASDPIHAYEQQEHAYRLTQGSPDDARDLCRYALFAGRVGRAAEVMQLLDRLKTEVDEELRKTVESARLVQMAWGFEDAPASDFLRPIYQFVFESGHDVETVLVGAAPDEEKGVMTLDFIVNAPFDAVIKSQDALIEYRVAADEDVTLASIFAINIRENAWQ